MSATTEAAVGRTESGGVVKRLIRGMGSTTLQLLITAIIQLGTVPFLLHAWGAAKYGDWLILSAIPGYIVLTNLGFGDASGSDMTVRVAAGDRIGALETFQSSWALLSIIGATVAVLLLGSVWFLPWRWWMNLSTLSNGGAALVVLFLALYVFVSQQCGVFESGYRCDGNFATGTSFLTLLRLFETIITCAVGAITGSLVWAAFSNFASRGVGTIAYYILLRQRSPWIVLGTQHVKLSAIKELAIPGLGFLALPMASALTIHGFTILIAHTMGSVAVTAFSTLRTLTRVNFQLLTVVAWAMWPELSRAFGEGNIPLARTLHRYAYQSGLVLSICTGTMLWFVGPFIYKLWAHGVSFDPSCFHILLIVTFVNSLWFTSSVVPMSTNAHHKITLALVGISVVALFAARTLLVRFGLSGGALALLLVDLFMASIVLRTSLRQVQDRLGDFAVAMLTPPKISALRRAFRKA